MVSLKRIAGLCFLLLVSQSGRAFPPQDFTDTDLERVLREEDRVLLYSFSSSMSLSLTGVDEIRNAAADLHARVVFLLDPLTTEADLRSLSVSPDLLPLIRYQKSRRLRDLGIQLHYPSLVVSNNHRIVGSPIPGFKSRTGYVTMVSDLLDLSWKEAFRVSKTMDLPRPTNGVFFKPLYGTDFAIIGWAYPSYLLNVRTSEAVDIAAPAQGDAGVTPDGEFISFIGGGALSWFAVRDIMAKKQELLLRDPGLRTYQSMALLPGTSVYRVLGAESSSTAPTGLLFRDYEPKALENGRKTVMPISSWQRLCDDKRISIPMMSKTGLYLSGMYGESLKVFRIGRQGSECEEVFNSGAVTGKADFSMDDQSLVYVSRAENLDTVFVADLANHQVKSIFQAPAGSALFFPGFLNPDEIVVYDQAAKKMILLERTRVISPPDTGEDRPIDVPAHVL